MSAAELEAARDAAIAQLGEAARQLKNGLVFAKSNPSLSQAYLLAALADTQQQAIDRVLLAQSACLASLPRAETHPDEHRAGCDCASCQGRV